MSHIKLPKGFLVNGIHCGIKKKRKDLALFFSSVPCKIEALFTRNIVKAAPVVLAIEQLKKTKNVRGVLVNSGNANCMTGKRGLKDAKEMVKLAANELKVNKNEILVSSTGIIGEFMPMKPVIKGMKTLVKGLCRTKIHEAAEGIATTDQFLKIAMETFILKGKEIVITGVAKGAGMVHPDMATMLCYVMTDCNIEKSAIKKALKASTNKSFNAITVDGDMSTNDTIMVLANSEAKNKTIKADTKEFNLFQKKLSIVCEKLAKMIVEDGEGASKFIETKVKGAKTEKDAKKVAQAIGGSLLVKCAVLGGDPNWGRIASSAGSSGVKFDTNKIVIKLDGVTFFKKGKDVSHVNRKTSSIFKKKHVSIEMDLGMGKTEAVFYSCDISKKYIAFNSYYTT